VPSDIPISISLRCFEKILKMSLSNREEVFKSIEESHQVARERDCICLVVSEVGLEDVSAEGVPLHQRATPASGASLPPLRGL